MEAKETARRFLEAQDRLRGGPADELCADGYTFRIGGVPPMDLEGHKAFSAPFYAAFPDLTHDVQEVLAEEDRVAVRFRLTGTNTGDFMGHAPSGKTIDVGALVFMTISSGRVVDMRGEFDQLGLMQQLGLVPTQ